MLTSKGIVLQTISKFRYKQYHDAVTKMQIIEVSQMDATQYTKEGRIIMKACNVFIKLLMFLFTTLE